VKPTRRARGWTTPIDIERIYLLKREIIEMRHAVGALTPTLARFQADRIDRVPANFRGYLRTIAERNAAADRIISYDELLSSLLDAALGKVATQHNNDMRKIAAWAALAVVPTSVAGIYGMNFDHMPELHWMWGYPAALGVMTVVCLFLYVIFRRRHWL
jgi:magnesium transporter